MERKRLTFWFWKWLLNWSQTLNGYLGTAKTFWTETSAEWTQRHPAINKHLLNNTCCALLWKLSTYVSPAGPAPPPGRRRISWRGWSRNRPRTADPQPVHTPHAPRPDRSSVGWPMRRSPGWPSRWWGKPERPAEIPTEELTPLFYLHTKAVEHRHLHHRPPSGPQEHDCSVTLLCWYCLECAPEFQEFQVYTQMKRHT